MKERLKRVEAFSELSAGMLVVVKPCDWCGGTHRGIIAKWVKSRPTLSYEGGGVESASGWGVLPAPSCEEGRGLPILIATDDPLKNLFRVIDPGLEDSHSQTTSRPLERVK